MKLYNAAIAAIREVDADRPILVGCPGYNDAEYLEPWVTEEYLTYSFNNGLKRNKHSISEVAYIVGFSDPKYFSTSFKKYFGKSPSAFVEKPQSIRPEDK